jgi:hypothetical protein
MHTNPHAPAPHEAFYISKLLMKYFLTLAVLLFCISSAHAQRKQRPQPPPPLTVPIVYCELVGNASYHIWELSLDYGQEAPALVQDADLAEASAYVGKLTSFAAALNYLYNRGWEVVNTSVTPRDLDKDGSISNRVRYLLRRRTP